jgi:hypothetical protein
MYYKMLHSIMKVILGKKGVRMWLPSGYRISETVYLVKPRRMEISLL